MAQITTVLLPPYTIPKTKPSQQSRNITMQFSPTELAAAVTSGDTIAIVTLPKDAQVYEGGVRFLGVSGLSLSYVTLQVNENSTVSQLTNPLSAAAAGSAGMITAPPAVDDRYVKTVELLVGGGSIDNTATGICVVSVNYNFYNEAG